MCKAFVIVANEEYVLLLMWQMKSVRKAFVIVVNEDCVQSFCYCGE